MNTLRNRIRQWQLEMVFDVAANKILGATVVPRPLRWRGLRALGMDVRKAVVSPGCFFGSRRISIGTGVQIGREVYFDGAADITLCVRSGIGPRSMIITGAHRLAGHDERVGVLAPRPVVIGPGAWLGAGVLVLPGVTIGAGCVVGAGAVVVEDCAPDGLYVGFPAARVRDLEAPRPAAPGPAAPRPAAPGPAAPRPAAPGPAAPGPAAPGPAAPGPDATVSVSPVGYPAGPE